MPIEKYVQAVNVTMALVRERQATNGQAESSTAAPAPRPTGNVFITTEDPTALIAFRNASPSWWKIYTYAPATANVT